MIKKFVGKLKIINLIFFQLTSIDYIELWILGGEGAPLTILPFIPHPVGHGEGLCLAVQGHAGVTFLFRCRNKKKNNKKFIKI